MRRLREQRIIIIFLVSLFVIDWRMVADAFSPLHIFAFTQRQHDTRTLRTSDTPLPLTDTPASTYTATITVTRTATASSTPTMSRTATRTRTPSKTGTPSNTATRTITPTATRSVGSRVPAGIMGLVGRDPFYEVINGQVNTRAQLTMGQMMKSIGVRWVRLDMRIPLTIGATQAQIDAAISQYDYFINTVAPANNLKVLLLLNFDLIMGVNANQIAVGPFRTHPQYGPGYNAYMTEWMFRAQRVVMRYGKKIHAIEVLNEANRLARYTPSGPIHNGIPPEHWAQLITTLYRSCNGTRLGDYCRATPIILGGLHPRGTVAHGSVPARTDMEYLAAIYASKSFTTAFAQLKRWPLDAVGYHPYPWELRQIGVTTMTAAFDRLRAQLNALNDPLRPVWVTEIGYNVAYARQSEAGQAEFLANVYRTLSTRKLADGNREIGVIFWFKYEDFPPASGAEAQQWGLVTIPFSAGPCPEGFCYRRNGLPSYYRKSWYIYRDLTMP